MTFLDCGNLKACDEYFEIYLQVQKNPKIIGYIELSKSELKHLTKVISYGRDNHAITSLGKEENWYVICDNCPCGTHLYSTDTSCERVFW